ncbi:helix-turn-helix domain-containing protein [Anabaena azotica]|uniref:Helix-turn-helix transcriptional regulator n=1 Tax=Anabaena azotica FACHB-119 TaxID=947527 RepID=A0ABR8DBN3_9NOST|nr:helix-turn-helix transcriptional regulator [Anabaena azotica]MBD2504602.1 helix-turn-helix transcriptional regulator [Anabaena azotica FACHB-119]
MQNRIKQFIEDKGISRYKFWQDTKLGRDTAYRLCNDPNYVPTGSVLDKICTTYRVQPGELLVWLPDEEPCLDVIADSQISQIDDRANINQRPRKESKDQADGIVLPFERQSA